MDFGYFVVAVLGYGVGIAFLLAAWEQFKIAVRLKKAGPTARAEDGSTYSYTAGFGAFCVLVALVVFVATRLILGIFDKL